MVTSSSSLCISLRADCTCGQKCCKCTAGLTVSSCAVWQTGRLKINWFTYHMVIYLVLQDFIMFKAEIQIFLGGKNNSLPTEVVIISVSAVWNFWEYMLYASRQKEEKWKILYLCSCIIKTFHMVILSSCCWTKACCHYCQTEINTCNTTLFTQLFLQFFSCKKTQN